MILTYIKIFLCRNDVKIILVSTVTDEIVQIISKKYLKNHPEFLEDGPMTKKKYRLSRVLSLRGGAFIEISGINFKFIEQVVINFLSKKGLIAGALTGASVIIRKILETAISTYLRDALLQNLPDKKKFILLNGEKFYLDQCNQNLEYLFKALEDPVIPFEEKKINVENGIFRSKNTIWTC